MISRKHNSRESGYVLLALLLMVALISIGIFTTIQRIDFQIKRDREEELIHRGVQYSRAVRKYFKAFGRYPTNVEQLENTNNQRFLRHRYKDPITGKDFKLLRLTDVQMSFGSTPGTPVSEMNQQPGAPGALNNEGGGLASAGPSAIASQPPSPDQATGNQPTDAPNDGSQADPSVNGAQGGTPPPPQPLSQQTGTNGAPQVFGGVGIVGVASISKDKTIREFNKKNHYNQWQFVYDPTLDRGGLLMTPNQPPLNANMSAQPQNGTNPASASGFGSSSGQSPAPAPPQNQ